MIRSLYSGVAGLKTQQTKMDVIGNNIANVGTYGFKSDRATFKDVYYQTTQTATASTGNTGGTNAKQIGYGNLVGSIDTNTKTSAMSSTGYGRDIAIAGEGFLQVMGADGNIMYTKAGMLDIDAEGNLVDVNGNFVLGVNGSDTTLPPSSQKIQVALPYLDANTASVNTMINNVDYTISASNPTNKGNVSFTFVQSSSLPAGQKMSAKISGDSITVTVNANEDFADIDAVNTALNDAIKAANGGVEHPAGEFTMDVAPAFTGPLKGSELVSSNFSYVPGEVNLDTSLKNMFKISNVGEKFSGDLATTTITATSATGGTYSAAGLPITISDGTNTRTVTYTNADLAGLQSAIAAADITTASYDATNGEITISDGTNNETVSVSLADLSAKANASATGGTFSAKLDQDTNGNDVLTITCGAYTGTVTKEHLSSAGEILMTKAGADPNDSFVISYPSAATLKSQAAANGQTGMNATTNTPTYPYEITGPVTGMTPSEDSKCLGLGQTAFKLTGGTEGGEQTVANLTSISIDQNGRLIGVHDIYGIVELGRIDLATFANPAGLQKVGSTYFEESLNSGEARIVQAGTEGTGQIMASTLEASNVDLSNEFSDMIMTQRGFQASSRVITVSDTMLEELINLKR